MGPTQNGVREWVGQALAEVTGLDPRRLTAATGDEARRAVDGLASRFAVDVDPVTGDRVVTLRAGGGRGRGGAIGDPVRTAGQAALASRAALLLPDALERLTTLRPVVQPVDQEELEATRRVVDTALRGLADELATAAAPVVVVAYLDQLLTPDENGDDGAVGRLGRQLGLLDPRNISTADEERTFVAYLAMLGHVRCLAHGWDELDVDVAGGFGAVAGRVVELADCVADTADDVLDVLRGDGCLSVVVADPDDRTAPGIDLVQLVRTAASQSVAWRTAAGHGRSDLLALQSHVDLVASFLRAATKPNVLKDVLAGAELERARAGLRRLAELTDDVSKAVASLERPDTTAAD